MLQAEWPDAELRAEASGIGAVLGDPGELHRAASRPLRPLFLTPRDHGEGLWVHQSDILKVFARRSTLRVRSGPGEKMGEAPEQNGSLKDVIFRRAARLLPMAADLFPGSDT